jgi:cellulose synthase/poly-beta-1,6-N-acetylglucosamine synthase-like glycosyltransferase
MQALYERYEQLGRPILDTLHILFDNLFHFFLYVMAFACMVFLLMAMYTAIRKNKPAGAIDESYTPSITIQIPTRNELAAMRCAEACLQSDYPKDKYHILIGDDSNKPEISKKLVEFTSHHEQVAVVRREHNIGYKPGNLNNMIPHSKGEFIIIFDSDFVPGKDFLKRVVQPFKDNPKVAAVQARWTFLNDDQNFITILGASILNVYHYITLPFIKNRRNMSLLCGSAEAVRKSTLVELGSWDAGNLTEDIEYSIRAIDAGYRIAYLEELTCDSEVPYTSSDLYRQQMRWAYGVIHSFKKHFNGITSNKLTTFEDKVCLGMIGCGYLVSFVLLAMLFTGLLSILTHPPTPVDWGKFLWETGKNLLLTSGLIISTIVAMRRSRTTKHVVPMLASSFSYGLVMTYHINKGILKAILGRPMEWFMLAKKANEVHS